MLHQIGSGVLGPVFRTYDPAADRLVAVKAFRLDQIPEDVARLVELLRRVTGHAGQLAAGLEGASAYVAMPFHPAETLDVALRHLAPAPLGVALPILSGLAAAVDAAWSAGPHCGHGALHPRDVFVTAQTHDVAVSGFGIVPALDALRVSGVKAPVRRPYTAPERAAGSVWDQRADVFSVAVIAHELLTGRRPAGPGEQDGALPASMSPEVRAGVRRVLARALAEDPAGRYATAMEFVEALGTPADLAAGQLPFDVPEPAVEMPLAPEPDAASASEPSSALAIAPVVEPAPPDEFDLAAVIDDPIERRAPLAHATPPAAPGRPIRPKPVTPVVRDRRPPSREPAEDLRLDPPALEAGAPFAAPPLPAAAPYPLPPPIPWLVVGAVALASAIVAGAAFYHLGLTRGRAEGALGAVVPAVTPAAPSAPGPAAPVVPAAPAPGDTDVPVTPPARTEAPVGPGRLTIRSTPPGATVTLDGAPAGRTPVTLRGLATGTHVIVVSRPGYASDTRRATLTRRAPSATINATLKADRAPARGAATGSLAVDSRPRGAAVMIDGKAVGVSPLSVPGLTPGTHTVRLTRAGYAPLTTTVTVRAGETARLAVTLEQR